MSNWSDDDGRPAEHQSELDTPVFKLKGMRVEVLR